MRLRPFDLADTRAFLSDQRIRYTDRQIVELYMVLGGVPYYLDLVERRESVPHALDRLLFDRDGPLRGEFDRLFVSLFGEAAGHEAIVRTLARRREGFPRGELLASVGMGSGGSAKRLLDALEQSGFVITTIPFGRRSRDRFYRLVDGLSLFHLCWLTDRRRVGNSWLQLRGKPAWRAWAGLAFESLCLEHVSGIKRSLGIAGVETSQAGWYQPGSSGARGAQIDLLIDRADDVISVCEMKYTDEPFVMTRRHTEDLQRKLAVFREATRTRKKLQLVLVSAQGIKRNRWSDDIVDAVVEMDALFEQA